MSLSHPSTAKRSLAHDLPARPAADASSSMVELVVPVPVELLTMHAALPEIISQRNVLTVTGIPPAAFLRMLRDPAFPLDVIKQGKLRLVDRETFVTWLKAQGQRVSAATQEAPAVDPRLAKAGFVRRAGKSRG